MHGGKQGGLDRARSPTARAIGSGIRRAIVVNSSASCCRTVSPGVLGERHGDPETQANGFLQEPGRPHRSTTTVPCSTSCRASRKSASRTGDGQVEIVEQRERHAVARDPFHREPETPRDLDELLDRNGREAGVGALRLGDRPPS